MKSEQLNEIQLYFGKLRIINEWLLFIDHQKNLKMMNLETKDQKDLKISNCELIHSFEDKVLIQTNENFKWYQKLFQLKESELLLLDEKTGSDDFGGSGNLGILSNGIKLLNFSSGNLIFFEDKVGYKNRKYFYNFLVGPTEYPEFAEKIC